MKFTLELQSEDVSFIQQTLGELPSKTGAFMLMQKIDQQVKPQADAQMMPPRAPAPAADAPPTA